jgi:hypothetical protein
LDVEAFCKRNRHSGVGSIGNGKDTEKYEQKMGIDAVLGKGINFVVVLTLSLLWECIEHYIEAGILPGMAGEG